MITRRHGFIAALAAGVIFAAASAVSAQSLDNKGTEFILGFIPNFDSFATIELHITSEATTNVTVEYPVNSPTFTTTEAISPGTVTIIELPNTAASGWSPDAVANNAVRVSAPDEFIVYLINRRSASSDAALGLPVDAMNTEYIIMDYNPVFVGAEFVVVAGFDNTTVTITPTKALVGRSAGVPFDIVLNRGEGYFGRSSTTAFTETLTGTTIKADRPVGVTNGNGCTQVPTGTDACDHIFEVAQPVQTWGTTILAANLPNRPNGSIYRILASEDGTTVTQGGAVIANLNRGNFHETPIISGNHVFSADKPVFVSQFMTGQSSPGAILGDPAMGNLAPSAQYLSNYTFSTVGGGQFSQHFLTVIAEDADINTIALDGTPIGAESFTSLLESGFSAAVIPLTEGTHATSSNGVHGITVEGFNSFDSYLYPGGALFQFINPMGDSNPPICAVPTVTGSPPFATGSATDNRPTEDINGNDVLDPGEDLNGNGVIDEDTGIFFVALEPGASNLGLAVDPFVPGDEMIAYTVSLINPDISGSGIVKVTDGSGNTCQVSINLASAPLPTANAGPDQTVKGGAVVQLDGTGSSNAISFSWSQNIGVPVTLTGATTATPTFTAPETKIPLVFTLTVTNPDGITSTDSVTINVTLTNNPPVADPGPDQSVNPGATVTLNAGGSSDPEGHPISFVWVQIGGPTVSLSSETDSIVTFVAPNTPSNLAFRLDVTDRISQTSSAIVVVTVGGTPVP